MKKLLILPAVLLMLGLTGCGPLTVEEAVDAEVDVIVEEMEVEAEALLEEEAVVDTELLDLETE